MSIDLRSLLDDNYLKSKLVLAPVNDGCQAVLYDGKPVGFIAKPYGMSWRRWTCMKTAVGHDEPMDAAIDEFRAVFKIDENGRVRQPLPLLDWMTYRLG